MFYFLDGTSQFRESTASNKKYSKNFAYSNFIEHSSTQLYSHETDLVPMNSNDNFNRKKHLTQNVDTLNCLSCLLYETTFLNLSSPCTDRFSALESLKTIIVYVIVFYILVLFLSKP